MVTFDEIIDHFAKLAKDMNPSKPMVGFVTGIGTYHMIRTVNGACVRLWGWDREDVGEDMIGELAIQYGNQVDSLPDEDILIGLKLEEPAIRFCFEEKWSDFQANCKAFSGHSWDECNKIPKIKCIKENCPRLWKEER